MRWTSVALVPVLLLGGCGASTGTTSGGDCVSRYDPSPTRRRWAR
jgi:hypothetical protein